MTKFFFYIIIAFLPFSQTACLQNKEKYNGCYADNLSKEENVFTNFREKPHYNGGHNSLAGYLSANINFEKFINGLQDERTYVDTANITFIVNKDGGISNLSINTAYNKIFADEITRVMKMSACNWIAGREEGPVNGWHRFDLYYSVEKPSGEEVKTRMTINEL